MTTYNLFPDFPTEVQSYYDGVYINLGTEFYVTSQAWVTQIRIPCLSGYVPGTATIWERTADYEGTQVSETVTLSVTDPNTWSVGNLSTPFELTPNVRYRVGALLPPGQYAAQESYFNNGPGATDLIQGPVVLPSMWSVPDNNQGSYRYNNAISFPDNSFNGGCYFVDVTITDVDPAGGGSTTRTIKRREDGAWVTHEGILKVYRSGEWVEAVPKRRVGSTWEELT